MNVWVTPHAAVRFEERVRPGLSARAASVELARLVREFGRVVEWPSWVPEDAGVRENDSFCVELSDGVVVVCLPATSGWPRAVTVLTRCSWPRERRGRLPGSGRRRDARQAAWQEKHGGGSGRRRVSLPDVDEA